MMAAYRFVTSMVTPLMPAYLRRRERKGKEEALRISERLGHSSLPRPDGALIWIHAASVGEANAVQPFIEALMQRYPMLHLLLTTGTVTSARLMKERLPRGAMHQYVPVDTPDATRRFIAHWKPDISVWVESELWPNLLHAAHEAGSMLLLVNARMSPNSFSRWKYLGFMIRPMLAQFSFIYAQSEDDAARFHLLGGQNVMATGNLKYDGDPLPVQAQELVALERIMEGRARWLAASTHEGEELAAAMSHMQLRQSYPDVLTLIVPRHPARGEAIAQSIQAQYPGLSVALRSRGESIHAHTGIYIADTLGELGLFYRLSPIVFMGGSLIPHGGQNPLEAARLGCAIVCGVHMENFADMISGLRSARAVKEVLDAQALAEAVRLLLGNPAGMAGMAARGSAWVIGKSGVNERLLAEITPRIEGVLRHAV